MLRVTLEYWHLVRTTVSREEIEHMLVWQVKLTRVAAKMHDVAVAAAEIA